MARDANVPPTSLGVAHSPTRSMSHCSCPGRRREGAAKKAAGASCHRRDAATTSSPSRRRREGAHAMHRYICQKHHAFIILNIIIVSNELGKRLLLGWDYVGRGAEVGGVRPRLRREPSWMLPRRTDTSRYKLDLFTPQLLNSLVTT